MRFTIRKERYRMICPVCGHKRLEVYSTHPKEGRIYRTRICPKCGQKYTTVEQIVKLTRRYKK